MRVDLPLCDFHNCRYYLDGNCTAKDVEHERCEYRRFREGERDKAVEDLTKLATKPITPCHSCSKTCVFPASLAPELQPATWCRDWQWRGTEGKA